MSFLASPQETFRNHRKILSLGKTESWLNVSLLTVQGGESELCAMSSSSKDEGQQLQLKEVRHEYSCVKLDQQDGAGTAEPLVVCGPSDFVGHDRRRGHQEQPEKNSRPTEAKNKKLLQAMESILNRQSGLSKAGEDGSSSEARSSHNVSNQSKRETREEADVQRTTPVVSPRTAEDS